MYVTGRLDHLGNHLGLRVNTDYGGPYRGGTVGVTEICYLDVVGC